MSTADSVFHHAKPRRESGPIAPKSWGESALSPPQAPKRRCFCQNWPLEKVAKNTMFFRVFLKSDCGNAEHTSPGVHLGARAPPGVCSAIFGGAQIANYWGRRPQGTPWPVWASTLSRGGVIPNHTKHIHNSTSSTVRKVVLAKRPNTEDDGR